jgi:ABC-type sugar transport system ATPase subunit
MPAVILVSHDIGQIHQFADRFAILERGELVGTYASNEITLEALIAKILARKAVQVESS